jgi:mannitol 2-dehydrogenase
MTTLSNTNLAELDSSRVARPEYDRSRVRPGIAHFGVGNFHRTHEAVYVDRCLHLPGNEGWGIVGIGISDSESARQKAEKFRRQDCLYTVTEFSPDGGRHSRVIGAMVSYLHAPSEPEAVLTQLSDPDLRIVSMTITEGGYNIDEVSREFVVDNPLIQADLRGGAPATVFGFIVQALARRRAAGVPPFTVVSCDNLRQSGATAKKAVLGFARALDPEMAGWIDANVAFPNSMVDRIAPSVTADDRFRLNSSTGVDDLVPAMSESYIQWVIEDRFPTGRPDLHKVGVELRDDVELFEAMKGRLLNASHVLMSYPSVLLGHRLVDEGMADPRIQALLHTFTQVDSIPLVTGPAGVSLEDYRDLVLNRFSNPSVGDQLLRVASDGAAKIPVFHSRTLAELLERGCDIRREAFLLACYDRYLEGIDETGASFEVSEPSLSDSDRESIRSEDGLGLLRIPAFASLNLEAHSAFVSAYQELRASIAADGVGATLDRLNG